MQIILANVVCLKDIILMYGKLRLVSFLVLLSKNQSMHLKLTQIGAQIVQCF